jgi:hypothetical protein
MGWTFATKPHGTSTRDYLHRVFSQELRPGQSSGFAILHDCLTDSEFYAVIDKTDKDTGAALRFCLVVLIQPGTGHHGFGWKEMEESMCPYVIPPRSFFTELENLIPAPEGKYAAEWRDRCRAHYAGIRGASG